MRALINTMHIKHFLFHFNLRNVPTLPTKNSVECVLVGSIWHSAVFSGFCDFTGKFKPLTTKAACPDEDLEFWDGNISQILSVIENNPNLYGENCSVFVDKLCKSGNMSAAVRLLQTLRDKEMPIGINLNNIILVAASERNDMEMLSQVFKDMVESCEFLPMVTYFDVAKAFANTSDDTHLLRLVKEISELSVSQSKISSINKIIFAFGECRQFDKALLVFDYVKGLECKPDLYTYNIIMDILGKAGQLNLMIREFVSMKEAGIVPDFVSYNTLLYKLRKFGRLDLCKVYFKEMCDGGIKPDLLTYKALIDSFGQAGNIEEALRLFREMKKMKIRPSIYVYRSIIDCCKKMGKLELARIFSAEMKSSISKLAGPKDFKRRR